MKKQKNTIRLKFYLILLSMLFIGACSKDDSSSPDLPDTEGGSIHVTGDLAVQGDKVITDAEFEYDGQYGISFYIFGDDDQGGGFSMVLGGYFENPESVVETGSYTIAASGSYPDKPYFRGTYTDNIENVDGTYTSDLFDMEGQLNIIYSSAELIKAEFEFIAKEGEKVVNGKGSFTAVEW